MDKIRIDFVTTNDFTIDVKEDSQGAYFMIGEYRVYLPTHYTAHNFSGNDVVTFFIDKIGDVSMGVLGCYLYDLIKSKNIKNLKINKEELFSETEIKEVLENEQNKKTIEELKREYDLYQYLGPSHTSIDLVKRLWEEWEKKGVTAPDVDKIVTDCVNSESLFFKDIVLVTSKVTGQNLIIDYYPLVLDNYNLCAISASDGYLVIIDQTFFKLLFTLTNILMFDAYGLFSETEVPIYTEYAQKLVGDYLNKSSFNQLTKAEEHDIELLFSRDFETSEFSIYLFNSFRIFMMAHEISHHILNHTQGSVNKNFNIEGKIITIEVDRRELKSEYEADLLAYKIFCAVLDTKDDSIKMALCIYRFEFAPILLFDLFDRFDRLTERQYGSEIKYDTHPSPLNRKENILEHYKINTDDSLYCKLREVIATMLS